MAKVVTGAGTAYLFDDVKHGGISLVEVAAEELSATLSATNS
jgi:hypothetical protein